MKRFCTSLIIAIISIGLFQTTLQANQIAALDLSLLCTGGNDYQVRFAFYRDCSGIAAPTSVDFTFTCQSNPLYGFVLSNVPQKAGSGIEVTPGYHAVPTRCQGAQYQLFGVEEYIYEAQVTLPPCSDWIVSWTGCCRAYFNTISNPTGSSAYIEARLNNLDAPCNSNPIATKKSVVLLVKGYTYCYNHGMFDPDGDSLSYFMVTPFNNNSTSYVNWVPPYSANQPLPSSYPVNIDNITGDICITPSMNIVTPVTVKTEEWRTINGVPILTGTIYRDLMLRVITILNNQPVLSGIDTTMTQGYDPNNTLYNMEIPFGKAVNFAIWGYDPDTCNPATPAYPEKFSIQWNNGIPEATFQAYFNRTDSAYATFTWTPDSSHVSQTPHCFIATIKDLGCPVCKNNSYEYCLTVKDLASVITANERSEKPTLLISPNPTSDLITITVDKHIVGNVSVNLFNNEGQCVYNETFFNGLTMSDAITLNLGHLPTGLYLVNFISDKLNITRKVMLIK